MATKPFLVVIFWPETSFFGDETFSRRHFEPRNSLFGDETFSRQLFEVGNPIFWRRNPFSSPF
ncbi:hypothetical protein LI012_17875 [Caldibacillus thermoamylovorans]|uniref:hypothetical protein n=1 Tax=Caldibacillus thermoamylovorans TaxID=35841 RepID=UPI001D085854|nr:hypothetical protein [Caldibacillus thermoamylovorans]MCB5934597.1 hypothetical protein [Bacillus sp. DFI.2.34]MCB7078646.1 hypothetical protein [Caldibacillus thermoamylovorans]